MDALFSSLYLAGLIPVIRIDNPTSAVPLARALREGGLPLAEVTFRTQYAAKAMEVIADQEQGVLLGAGTVTKVEQVDLAISSGARFIVTPGFNPAVVSRCLEKGIPIIPGCSSPSDMEMALSMGLKVVKFFPAVQSGGVDFLKAVSAPYTELQFIPTGGIGLANVLEFLRCPHVLACGGSWMVKPELVNAGRFDLIQKLVTESVLQIQDFTFDHLGINHDNEADALLLSNQFSQAFGIGVAKSSANSIFNGSMLELMKNSGRGEKGHLAIGTTNVDRACAYLAKFGYTFAEDTQRKAADGKKTFVYLQQPFSGFALHLLQK